MSRLKISKLYIKNFKCFSEADFDFERNNLIVFDGPNGYGKTTAFEAIEILLTKTPRKIFKVNLDARYTYKNSPIHKVESEPIEISVIFSSEETGQLEIKRVIPAATGTASRKNNINQIFSESQLYINDEIADEALLATYLSYSNIGSLFNVLNYVEQDENTYFLKEDPKDRYRALVSLLGGDDERLLHEKTELFVRKLDEKTKELGTAVTEIENRNSDLLSASPGEIDFEKLLTGSQHEFVWDTALVANTNLDVHNAYINEIKKVEFLFSHKSSIADIQSLKKINDILNNANFLSTLVDEYWKITNYDLLKNEDNERIKNNNTVNNNKRVIQFLEAFDILELLTDSHFISFSENNANTQINFPVLKSKLTDIQALTETLSAQNQILSDLKQRREGLIQLFTTHNRHTALKDSECPACGYDWGSTEELIRHLTETEKVIFSAYDKQNESFEAQTKELQTDFFAPFKAFLEQQNQNLETSTSALINAATFARLRDIQLGLRSQFSEFLSLFPQEVVTSITSLIGHRILSDRDSILKAVEEIVNKSKPIVDSSININELVTDFNRYFSGRVDLLEALSNERFVNKVRYINFQYYNAVNTDLQQLKVRKSKLDSLKAEFTALSTGINDKIKTYTKAIVEKISIPFYIFTGKILQNHSLGSGLVLNLEINREISQIYIRPKNRDQEVTYTLSSGQLSATVISLMLVLNKVFDQSKLGTIFIDDPLQTLDEINSHSLVELLKYNFGEQQILLSTHEDRYSQFMQYKFNKFNLSNKSVRLKDLL